MSQLLQKVLAVSKPVIALAHLPALPGTPRYEASVGVDGIVERVRTDVRHLLAGGVDAVMFCNEDDRPYVFRADPASVAVMARVIAELRPADRPLGTGLLWGPLAPLAPALATRAA